jgi:GNAT superfamily N-acetyltransferase
MSEQSIRRALPADAEGFVRAHEASWDATIGAILGRSLGELAPFADRVARFRAGVEEPPPHTGVWVAERDGEIVGIAVRSGAELRDLYVVPEAWGRGVANELMEAALADIRGDDSAEALLWVGEENARARRFYEREGWTQSNQTRASALGPSEVQYRLDLTN